MQCQLKISNQSYTIDLENELDISLKIKRTNNVNAYYISEPTFNTFKAGSFIGNVSQGGACNCENIVFNPHGNGTHTECVGHVSEEFKSILNVEIPHFMLAQLISIEPKEVKSGEFRIDLDQIEPHFSKDVTALIIRTLPNSLSKLNKKYSGTNPCYLDPNLTAFLAKKGIQHLLVDLPSVDPENDGGRLEAHKKFWQFPGTIRNNACITELVFVANNITDGNYVLHLGVAPFESDASPSTPILYELIS